MVVLGTLIAGLFGTLLMSIAMYFIHRREWANADMIRALGSAATRSYKGSYFPGLGIHFSMGVLFAFPYAAVIGAAHGYSAAVSLGIGALIGFVHGFVMGFLLLALTDKHPVERFRGAGFEVAAAHLFGHVVYGIGVAVIVRLFGIDWGFEIATTP